MKPIDYRSCERPELKFNLLLQHENLIKNGSGG